MRTRLHPGTSPEATGTPGSRVHCYEIDCTQLRLPAAGLLVGGIALAHLPSTLGLPCPFLLLTGLPCPFCGLTTSIRALGAAHVVAALQAAPLGILVALGAVCSLAGLLPSRIRIPIPILLVGLVGEWLFELARFHAL